MTTTKLIGSKPAALGLCLAGALLAGACSADSFNILNTNSPTVDQLTGNPTRAILARAALGSAALTENDLGGEIVVYAIFGREGWNLLGNDPRLTTELIRGPLNPRAFGGFGWLGKYAALRTINTYLDAIPKAKDLSAAEATASTGFAQTLKALMFHRLILRNGALGIPLDVNHPIDAPPAPWVKQADVYTYIVALLDSAKANLQAGSGAFPFSMPAGYESFATPGDFIRFNRALAARVLIHQATFTTCGNSCFQSALTALGESFLTTGGLPGSLSSAANYFFSAASGEPGNPITENLNALQYYVNTDIVNKVQLKANGDPDDRLTSKVRVGAEKQYADFDGIYKPILYNDNTPTTSAANPGALIPIIKNEELILLRAEANLGIGNLQAAIDDINLIRVNSGGLALTTLTAGSPAADILTELLYNRTYSLLWEQGTRWIDARRYGRLNLIELDRPGDVVFSNMPVPGSECDARGFPASTACTP